MCQAERRHFESVCQWVYDHTGLHYPERKRLLLYHRLHKLCRRLGIPGLKELDQHLRTYYDTAVRENRYYSEDWTFCENWRDIGGKVWIDKRVLLKHTGTYVFDYAAKDQLFQNLKDMEAENQQIQQAMAAAAAPSPAPVQSRLLATNQKTTEKKTANKKKK